MDAMKKFSQGLEKVWIILLYIAVAMMIALLCICAAMVLLRKIIHGGFNWADEAMRYLMVYATFLVLPYLVSKKKNIIIDLTDVIFPEHFVEKGKRIFDICSEFMTLACCLVLFPSCMAFINQNVNGHSTAMHLPLWLVYLCLPIGLGLGAIASINNLFQKLVLKEDL